MGICGKSRPIMAVAWPIGLCDKSRPIWAVVGLWVYVVKLGLSGLWLAYMSV